MPTVGNRPGVYVSEAPLQRAINRIAPTETVAAFIGTAQRGPTIPVFIPDWSSFSANYGGFAQYLSLPDAISQFFANGGSGCWVLRVVDSTASEAYSTYQDSTVTDRLTVTAISPGAWGKSVSFSVEGINSTTETFNLVIREDIRGASVVVERFTDLSMSSSSPRYVESVVNSPTIGSKYITVVDVEAGVGGALIPADASANPQYLTEGGQDGATPPNLNEAAYTSAVEELNKVDALLIVNCPGLTTYLSTVATSLANNRPGDYLLVADTEEVVEPDAITAIDSSYVATYYPWVYITDSAPDAPRGAVKAVPPGPSVVGMMMRVEAHRGVHKAPAGIGAYLSNVVASTRRLSNSELDMLANNNVNAIRPVPGSGIVVMGARTGSYDIARYVSVRRTLNKIKKTATEVSRFALFEPNTPALWNQLRVSNGAFLSTMWQNGALSGTNPNQGFYVKCDESINTPQTIANGEVHVEIGVAPVYPSEFIIIRVGQFENDTSVVVTEEVR